MVKKHYQDVIFSWFSWEGINKMFIFGINRRT